MQIPSRSNTYNSSMSLDASCAFPSWPRRDSLGSDHTPRASSYISDDDLAFVYEPVFPDEDTGSVSSYGSGTPSPQLAAVRHVTEEQIEEMRREQQMRQREFLAVVAREKEQRRRAKAAKQARKNCKKDGSPQAKSKLSAMTPIAE